MRATVRRRGAVVPVESPWVGIRQARRGRGPSPSASYRAGGPPPRAARPLRDRPRAPRPSRRAPRPRSWAALELGQRRLERPGVAVGDRVDHGAIGARRHDRGQHAVALEQATRCLSPARACERMRPGSGAGARSPRQGPLVGLRDRPSSRPSALQDQGDPVGDAEHRHVHPLVGGDPRRSARRRPCPPRRQGRDPPPGLREARCRSSPGHRAEAGGASPRSSRGSRPCPRR